MPKLIQLIEADFADVETWVASDAWPAVKSWLSQVEQSELAMIIPDIKAVVAKVVADPGALGTAQGWTAAIGSIVATLMADVPKAASIAGASLWGAISAVLADTFATAGTAPAPTLPPAT